MIWDTFTFNNELDMLQCRLEELEGYDVIHVLVESFTTHRGVSKPLYFDQNRARFARWQDRIRHVIVGDLPMQQAGGNWERLRCQRDMTWMALAPDPDDLVLISDVDEIPSAAVMTAEPACAALLMQRVACFAVDWVWPQPEPTGVLVRGGFLSGLSLAGVRDARGGYPAITDAGWHLSWMGGHEAHLAKLGVHCHVEQDTPDILRTITSGRAYAEGWHIGTKLIAADVDETWPRYVRERRCPADWFRPREEQPCPAVR